MYSLYRRILPHFAHAEKIGPISSFHFGLERWLKSNSWIIFWNLSDLATGTSSVTYLIRLYDHCHCFHMKNIVGQMLVSTVTLETRTLTLFPAWVYFFVAKWYCLCCIQTSAIPSRILFRSSISFSPTSLLGVNFSTRSSDTGMCCSIQSFSASQYYNKKVLLRERKRHTARRVAIAISCYPGGGGGGPSAKIFFPSLNMYQAKSGVKNFSLYWDRVPPSPQKSETWNPLPENLRPGTPPRSMAGSGTPPPPRSRCGLTHKVKI